MSRYYRSILATLGEFVYDVDMQAVIDKAITESFALPPTKVLRAMNRKLIQMKADGIWSKLDTYFNFATNSTSFANFSRICWKRRVLGTINGGLTTTVDGFEGNGVDSYFNVDFNPAVNGVNYTLNNACRGFVIYKSPQTGLVPNLMDLSREGTAARDSYFSVLTNSNRINQGGANTALFSARNTGLNLLIRDSSTLIKTIIKADDYSTASNSTVLTNESLYLLGHPVGTAYGENGLSSYFTGSALTYSESQLFRTAYNAYLNAIGLTQFA
jgi:hypothetical protein